jgi:RNA ligase (TIGR02306 family)
MSSFEVKVFKIEIMDHPNADVLELAKIGDYLSIIPKETYETGDLVVYIPEQAIVPDFILDKLNLKGRLAGKNCDRVKAMNFRGVVSQGLIYPNTGNWTVGQDVSEELNIYKYVPEIPPELEGAIFHAGDEYTLKYDIENIKRYNEIIKDGDFVQMTEKLHGTFIMVAGVPSIMSSEHLIGGRNVVASKGQAEKGFSFIDCDENKDNVYMKTAKEFSLFEIANKYAEEKGEIVIICGEIFGHKVQDLKYNCEIHERQFRVFDVAIGNERINKKFLSHVDLDNFTKRFNLQRVPLLYVGEFSKEILTKFTNGREQVSGNESHIREGLVVKPLVEKRSVEIGRVLLKSVSDAYLLRKDGTEYT